MNVKEIFRAAHNQYKAVLDRDCSVYEWAASEIFCLTMYDPWLDELFVKRIIEVCKAILEGKTFEYIEDKDSNYVTYALVTNLLSKYDWIDWGSSIRGAWFSAGRDARSILVAFEMDDVPFTEENIKALIEFVEDGGEKG